MLRDRRAALLFVGPALVVYALVVLVPVVWSLGYTLFEGSIISGFHFVGFANFPLLLQDEAFQNALWFTLRYAVVVTTGQILAGLGLSFLYIFYLKRSGPLVRTLIFFPVVLPTVAVGQLFVKIFAIAPQFGLLNAGLDLVGRDDLAQAWLGQSGTAFLVIVIMDIWRAMGFYAIILYAGLVEIPTEIKEAAIVDGASKPRLMRHIYLPLLTPILITSVIFSINGTLKVFDSVVALTGGGPGQATTPLTLHMFRTAFDYGDYGYGSTIAVALAAISLLVTLVLFRFARRDV